MSSTNNPKVDFGFHAVFPRIVRTSYKDLKPLCKWLYVCLKDLCGDSGVCFRTLEVLSKETDLSRAFLSESIPLLHKAGLIHAELKKRPGGGKPVWHITIIDIWQKNAKAHPTKRSQSEQTSSKNVHVANENIRHVNDTDQKRSPRERERSPQTHRSNTNGSNTITEVIPGKDGEQQSSQNTTYSPPLPPQKKIPSVAAQKIIHQWEDVLGYTLPITDDLITPAEKLVPCNPTVEDLISLKKYCVDNDHSGYLKKRGVRLWDCAREFEGWKSFQNQPSSPGSNTPTARRDKSRTTLEEMGKQYVEYNERTKQEAAARNQYAKDHPEEIDEEILRLEARLGIVRKEG